MGEQKVTQVQDAEQMQQFMQLLLKDVQALNYMLDHDWFESDVVRIGAEQEMVLIDQDTMRPACIAVEALEAMKKYDWVESELAKFNLETNLTPRVFEKLCFSQMEHENLSNLEIIREELKAFNADYLLIGILPTLRKSDVEEDNLMPLIRYKALMDGIRSHMSKDAFELKLEGIDEINIKHNTPLLEACNTSFQVHLQVSPKDFVQMYNISQALAGPVLSIATNSPLVFGKRLWHENRIALFQQALDTRATQDHLREQSPRVHFGKKWIRKSILDIYQEDISRYRVLLSADVKENSMESIAQNIVPKLKALQVHNSTVYRWNRPCYGISENGKPHLRIENRVFGSGPTVRDEVANAAFWLGAMVGMQNRYDDVTKHMSFADARDNFGKAAMFGIDTQFTWLQDQKMSANDLIRHELLPIAREGLMARGVDSSDIDTYLGTIQERCNRHSSGARWQLRAYTKLKEQTTQDEALTVMTAYYREQASKEKPIHEWELPELNNLKAYNPTMRTVDEFMTTDLFTVRKDDIIQLVAEMMNWRQIHYTPVEDAQGHLVGLVTTRSLLNYMTNKESSSLNKIETVADIMIRDVKTASPDTNIITAMDIMKNNNIGCLPILKDGKLVGLFDIMDVLNISGRIMRRMKT